MPPAGTPGTDMVDIRVQNKTTGQILVLVSCDGVKPGSYLNCPTWYTHEGDDPYSVVEGEIIDLGWGHGDGTHLCPDCDTWRPDVDEPDYVEKKLKLLTDVIEGDHQ